jgi:hypothetical protein
MARTLGSDSNQVTKDGRRVLVGWMGGTPASQSLARDLSLGTTNGGKDQVLLQQFVPELSVLRTKGSRKNLHDGTSTTAAGSLRMEIVATFSFDAVSSSPFGVSVLGSADGKEGQKVTIDCSKRFKYPKGPTYCTATCGKSSGPLLPLPDGADFEIGTAMSAMTASVHICKSCRALLLCCSAALLLCCSAALLRIPPPNPRLHPALHPPLHPPIPCQTLTIVLWSASSTTELPWLSPVSVARAPTPRVLAFSGLVGLPERLAACNHTSSTSLTTQTLFLHLHTHCHLHRLRRRLLLSYPRTRAIHGLRPRSTTRRIVSTRVVGMTSPVLCRGRTPIMFSKAAPAAVDGTIRRVRTWFTGSGAASARQQSARRMQVSSRAIHLAQASSLWTTLASPVLASASVALLTVCPEARRGMSLSKSAVPTTQT